MFPNTRAKIEQMITQGIIPGAVYSFNHNQTSDTFTSGYRELTPTIKKMTRQTLFDIASLTKVVGTNSLILLLLEKNQIKLNEPINKYLPSFQDKTVTILQLLTHTSAINGYIPNRNELTQAQLIEAFNYLPVSVDKQGHEVVYTDTGTILLGFAIENLFKQPVQTIIEQEVLRPLNLNHTTFNPNPKECAPTNNLHQSQAALYGRVHDTKASVLKEHCGSAGLFSNIDDLNRFCQMMVNLGDLDGLTFLQSDTIKQLHQTWTPKANKNRSLGWDLKYHPKSQHPILFHTGYTGTFILIDLQEKTSFVFLSNRVHPVDNRETYLQHRDELIDIYLNELD
ncbi:serine hydrolase domain-containing protein [Vagococcus zengguangii]|uniref:Beta-lactamase family protein n=1 Tax=Vagococcus zengguangii TaxID=2571750 RepID=A0A4D7CUZ6_9ENTE|nr:serine hydrolase domain-containing protein [Vagococcus zengguangii]QCI86100.1 beta-lactamase family protein [Vagococcus zengguangii]TLG78344.1 beta-lactamase family protein [Vagococcus zengguangii]